MQTVVLSPRFRSTQYVVLDGDENEIARGAFDNETDPVMIEAALREIAMVSRKPTALGLHIPYGGKRFASPVLANAESLSILSNLTVESPLHLPYCVALAEACIRIWPGTPIALCFDTAFFVALPAREQAYALDSAIMGRKNLRRFGFHGLYHEAAVRQANRTLRGRKDGARGRIISICLEPKPEVAAVTGTKPLMVTSGATPLEGIPGEIASGELDPAILLDLMEKKGMGPERINDLLTKESGILGLAGRRATIEEVLADTDDALRPVRNFLAYRIKLACGSAVATMSGADTVVFSGRYARSGETLGPEIIKMFEGRIKLGFEVCTKSMESIVAEEALAVSSQAMKQV